MQSVSSVVGITLAFGARLIREKLGIPLVTCHLAPVSFRSSIRPARHDGLWMPDWMPKFYKDSVWRLIDVVADRIMGPPIHRMCEKTGLPPVKRIMKNWIHSPDSVIGLFPDWFAEPQEDWPANTKPAGFVFYDEAESKPMPRALEKFMSAGAPPIVFTYGTAVKNAGEFFTASLEACERLNRRGVFLSRYKDQALANLPEGFYYSEYAPFSKLFPDASAIVHHGGIGTCAQAMRAGVPQLVVSIALDQHYNASRLSTLGVGIELCMKKYRGPAVAEALDKLLGNNALDAQCKKIAERLSSEDSVAGICQMIEGLGNQ